jgi:hypothetical protein
LRVLERSQTGHFVEMCLPEKIRAMRLGNGALMSLGAGRTGAVGMGACGGAGKASAATLEGTDFLKARGLQKAIHDRGRRACFYCLRHTAAKARCLDHVVPRVRFGRNSYRNLVSCCLECNTHKGDRAAADFLRSLCRQGRLAYSMAGSAC